MEDLAFFDRVLSLTGISIFSKKNFDSIQWMIFQISTVFIGLLIVVFSTGFVVNNISDLPLLIEALSIWTTGMVMFVSLLLALLYRKLRDILEETGLKDSIQDMPAVQYSLNCHGGGPKIKELKERVTKTHSKLIQVLSLAQKIQLSIAFFTALMYVFGAIFRMLVREDKNLRVLAFKMWFPWRLDDMRVYVVSFLFNCYCGYISCVALSAFAFTIILPLSEMIRQIRILTFIVLNLDELSLEINRQRNIAWQTFCTEVLSQCVDQYMQLKRYKNQLTTICQPYFLNVILQATMLVCVCSVKIAITAKSSPELIKYCTHALYFILFLLIFCLLGQQVQNECEKLDTAVFEKWYVFDEKYIRHLMIFHTAVRDVMAIQIFGSNTMSATTFAWFIKTGASFFTLMMSFLEEQ